MSMPAQQAGCRRSAGQTQAVGEWAIGLRRQCLVHGLGQLPGCSHALCQRQRPLLEQLQGQRRLHCFVACLRFLQQLAHHQR
ncbi:hypothetical protein AS591_09455 [Stenotrophomonas maltophilia]|nr:hypothetical protein AS591_09455 [Stenotrophomonas maltophilia]